MLGIAPAYAGNTPHDESVQMAKGDHPRLRGEHPPTQQVSSHPLGSPPPTRGTLLPEVAGDMKEGSPPPTRGTLKLVILNFPSLRITPAYAGNTHIGESMEKPEEDHPRLRGEHR